ncbi:DNA modification methylase [Burkholderia dolosa AU0158]|nr:DNA modification methylase [Burkholderia dolosa AU0158]
MDARVARARDSEAQAERVDVRVLHVAVRAGNLQLPEDEAHDDQRDHLGPARAEHGRHDAPFHVGARQHRLFRGIEGVLLRSRSGPHPVRRRYEEGPLAQAVRRQQVARDGLQPEGRLVGLAPASAARGARRSSDPEAAGDHRADGARELPAGRPRARSVHGQRHDRGGLRTAGARLRRLRDQRKLLRDRARARERARRAGVRVSRAAVSPIESRKNIAMSRIQQTFAALAEQGRKGLIPFITAGDPDPAKTVEFMHALAEGGADVIELGVPFSDPMADGPVIQRSSERALARGVTLRSVLADVKRFRETDRKTPVVLMGYANPIERIGVDAFAAEAHAAGVDGVLVVDYPPEEAAAFAETMRAAQIDPIFLLAPTSTDERIAEVGKIASGYVYYVSLKGVTGAGNLDVSSIAGKIPAIKSRVPVPVGVGFGIRDADTARAVAEVSDAVVIGSRLVQLLESAAPESAAAALKAFIAELRTALDGAGSTAR